MLAGHGGGFGTEGHKRVDAIVALESTDKFVLGYPGDHGQNLDRAQDPWARFFVSRLGTSADEAGRRPDLAGG